MSNQIFEGEGRVSLQGNNRHCRAETYIWSASTCISIRNRDQAPVGCCRTLLDYLLPSSLMLPAGPRDTSVIASCSSPWKICDSIFLFKSVQQRWPSVSSMDGTGQLIYFWTLQAISTRQQFSVVGPTPITSASNSSRAAWLYHQYLQDMWMVAIHHIHQLLISTSTSSAALSLEIGLIELESPCLTHTRIEGLSHC